MRSRTVGVVVDDEDGGRTPGSALRRRSRRRRRPASVDGSHERAGSRMVKAALARLALDGDVAAHQAARRADRQPQARAAEPARGRGLGLGERLEQPAELLGVMPMPVSETGNVSQRPCPSTRSRSTASVIRAVLGELGGVAQQVEQRLPHLGQVGVHRCRRRRGSRRPGGCRSCSTSGWTIASTSRTSSATSNVSRKSSILPASILERSRMSLISPSRCLPAALILPRSR